MISLLGCTNAGVGLANQVLLTLICFEDGSAAIFSQYWGLKIHMFKMNQMSLILSTVVKALCSCFGVLFLRNSAIFLQRIHW